MKFKVGDKVKCINSMGVFGEMDEVYTVKCVEYRDNNEYIRLYENTLDTLLLSERFELVETNYTFEDFKKAPIGTKVTFEKRKILVKTDKDSFDNINTHRDYSSLIDFKDHGTGITLGKIIKIEEPKYTEVYEVKPDALDKEEKEYLQAIIKPFRDKIKFIQKVNPHYIYDNIEYEYIFIGFKTAKFDSFALPDFAKNTMYKNMIADKKYTLEELGL